MSYMYIMLSDYSPLTLFGLLPIPINPLPSLSQPLSQIHSFWFIQLPMISSTMAFDQVYSIRQGFSSVERSSNPIRDMLINLIAIVALPHE